MHKFDIWIEGYKATGNSSPAKYICSEIGNSFEEACATAASKDLFEGYGNYDKEKNSLWGCRLFSTESQARASFG